MIDTDISLPNKKKEWSKTYSGRDPEFIIKWNCHIGEYNVFEKGKLIKTETEFSKVRSYLD